MRNNRKKRSAFLKLDKRKRTALCCVAMMTMPFLVGFNVNETATGAESGENKTVDEPFKTSAESHSVGELVASDEADAALARGAFHGNDKKTGFFGNSAGNSTR